MLTVELTASVILVSCMELVIGVFAHEQAAETLWRPVKFVMELDP